MFTFVTAQNLYNQAYNQGQWAKIWSKLTGRSRRLLNLSKANSQRLAPARVNAGLQTVSIQQIRGSESRCQDFDRDFNPLQNANEERWLRAAKAWQDDKPMPAVHLIQVGDIYFARNGHYRISAARALGQQEIDAEVTVWQINWPRWLSAAQYVARVLDQPEINAEATVRQASQLTTLVEGGPVS
jgi:hypothetical protein